MYKFQKRVFQTPCVVREIIFLLRHILDTHPTLEMPFPRLQDDGNADSFSDTLGVEGWDPLAGPECGRRVSRSRYREDHTLREAFLLEGH